MPRVQMSKEERDKLDETIVKAVATAATTFGEIHYAVQNGGTHPVDPRKTDRALQRLKEKGKIRFVRPGGWQVVS